MKNLFKTFLCSMLIVSLLTGCGKKEEEIAKVTCTMSAKDEFTEEVDTGVIEYQGDKVLSVEQKSVYKILDEEITGEELAATLDDLTEIASIYEDIDGYKVETEKLSDKEVSISLKIDYSKVNLDKIKEKLGDDYVNQIFPDGLDVTVDKVKKNNFEGFECK